MVNCAESNRRFERSTWSFADAFIWHYDHGRGVVLYQSGLILTGRITALGGIVFFLMFQAYDSTCSYKGKDNSVEIDNVDVMMGRSTDGTFFIRIETDNNSTEVQLTPEAYAKASTGIEVLS